MQMYIILRPREVDDDFFDEICHAFLTFGDANRLVRSENGDARIELDVSDEEAEKCLCDIRKLIIKLAKVLHWSLHLEIGLLEEIEER